MATSTSNVLGGAMAGAGAGAALGPWGALGGAVIGGAMSLFGGGSDYDPNEDLARQAQAIQMNQYGVSGPFGSVDWTGSVADGSRRMNVTLSPFEQSKLDQAQGMVPWLNSQFGDDASKRAQQSVYDSFMRNYQPQLDQARSDMQTRLVNQGIIPGSAAYNKAMASFEQSNNNAILDAMDRSVLTGSQVKQNELGGALSLFGAMQNINNPASMYMPGIGGQMQSTYGTQMMYDSARQQANASNIGAAMNIGGQMLGNYLNKSAAPHPAYTSGSSGLNYGSINPSYSNIYSPQGMYNLSDARIKENIHPVGQLSNGLTVYRFNFVWEDPSQVHLGLIAQEVAQVIPEAVSENAEGLLSVDYDLATQVVEDAGAQPGDAGDQQ